MTASITPERRSEIFLLGLAEAVSEESNDEDDEAHLGLNPWRPKIKIRGEVSSTVGFLINGNDDVSRPGKVLAKKRVAMREISPL